VDYFLKSGLALLNEFDKYKFEAYIVGGAVRDHLLDRQVKDLDITTKAPIIVLKRKFKVIEVEYGVCKIEYANRLIDCATYRCESDYSDYRHPTFINNAETVEEDLKRRDFTINALLMDKTGQIIDHVNGLEDLKLRRIKSIGDPLVRFNEDALRILRAFYFQAKLGFIIETNTLTAISKCRNNLLRISPYWIKEELKKIVKSVHYKKAFLSMLSVGIDETFPFLQKGIEFLANNDVDKLTIDLFYYIIFALNKEVDNSLDFSNKEIQKFKNLVCLVYKQINEKHLFEYGLENCLLANKIANIIGVTKVSGFEIVNLYDTMKITSIVDLKITSAQIINILDKKAGAWLKILQSELLDAVLTKKVKNTKEDLSKYIIENKK